MDGSLQGSVPACVVCDRCYSSPRGFLCISSAESFDPVVGKDVPKWVPCSVARDTHWCAFSQDALWSDYRKCLRLRLPALSAAALVALSAFLAVSVVAGLGIADVFVEQPLEDRFVGGMAAVALTILAGALGWTAFAALRKLVQECRKVASMRRDLAAGNGLRSEDGTESGRTEDSDGA